MDAGELATRSGTTLEVVERLVSLMILEPADGDVLGDGDITRVRLALAIEDSGISLDDVGRAIADGTLSFGFAEFATTAPVGLVRTTRRQLLEEMGMDADIASRLEAALGLPPRDPDEPVREDDAEMSVGAQAMAAGLSEETLVRTYRIFTQNLQRMPSTRTSCSSATSWGGCSSRACLGVRSSRRRGPSAFSSWSSASEGHS